MTTDRQKRAVRFCEEILGVKYEGDIDDYTRVSNFLGLYLASAKHKSNFRKMVIKDMYGKRTISGPSLHDAMEAYYNCYADKDWCN